MYVMWNFMKCVSPFFRATTSTTTTKEEEETFTKEEEDELILLLNCNNSQDLPPPPPDLLYFSRDYKNICSCTGKITFMSDTVGMIDDRYHFHIKDTISPGLSVGDFVQFKLYEDESDIFVKNVQKDTLLDMQHVNLNSAISFDDKCYYNITSFKLNLIGTVKKKIERNLFVHTEESAPELQEIIFNLDNVCSEFIPIKGDVLLLEGLFTDEKKKKKFSVEKISPKNTALKIGTVSKWDGSHGVIGNYALFSLESCERGYIPDRGDKVLASMIRISNNPEGYMWRAIQVIERYHNTKNRPDDVKVATQELVTNKCGVFIPVLSKFTLLIHTSIQFTVEVENDSSVDVELLSVSSCTVVVHHAQVTLVNPLGARCIMEPKSKLKFIFQIEAKFIGYSSSEYVWEFTGFKISRMFYFEVTSPELNEMISEQTAAAAEQTEPEESSSNHERDMMTTTAMKLLEQSSGVIIPGRKRYSRGTSFYPVHLGQFVLPRKILKAAVPEIPMNFEDILIQVEQVLPCLREELSPNTYSSRLSALLFLEEAKQLKQIGELSVERGYFRKAGGSLILDVPFFSAYLKLITGDKVLATVPRLEGGQTSLKFEGVIHKITKNELWINFSSDFHELYHPGIGYSLSFKTSRVAFRRMHQAVTLAKKFLRDRWLFPSGVRSFPPRITVDEASTSGEICVKRKKKRRSKVNWNRQGSGYGPNCSIDNIYHVDIVPVIVNKIKWFNTKLNIEQKEAVHNILKGEARPLPYIIFGPPGTGKSMTVAESILQIYNLFPNSRVLVATPSNSAADLITERLLNFGNIRQTDVIRLIGFSALEQGRITASIIPYAAVITPKDFDNDEKYLGIQLITRESASQYRIIVSTIGTLGVLFNLGFPRGYFSHIFVDEAGQATEPEILTVLILLDIMNGQVILAGDPFQLGPFVSSKLAIKYGLQESLLSRLLDRFPYKKDKEGFPGSYGYDPRLVTKLVKNYRSLPAILALPNMLFYNNDLVPNVTAEDSTSEESIFLSKVAAVFPIKGLDGRAPPVLFHGVQGTNSQERNSHSWCNLQEVYQVFIYLSSLYKAGISPDHVGIITPYQLQCLKIRQMLEDINIEPPKIGSVEEFQGQEKMLIIMSVVRSNLELRGLDTQKALGFVRNPRRVNVAISRARAMLIIIGNPHLLSFDHLWNKILKYCVDNNFYAGCNLPTNLT